MKTVVIGLQHWNYECGDGCCSEWGTNVFVNGVQVTSAGDQDHLLLSSILNALGYDATIVGIDEANSNEEIWYHHAPLDH